MRALVRIFVRTYKVTLSPVLAFLGGPDSGCRFWPTCSEYLLEAVEQHGFWRGSWFGAKRLLRCQPWGGSGFDPVPLSAAASDSEWVRKQGRGYNCRCASR